MDQRACSKVQLKKVQLFGSLKNHDIYHGQPEGLKISLKNMFSSLFWQTWSQPAQSVREGCIHGCTFHNTPIASSPAAKFSMNSDKLSAKSLTDKLPTGMMSIRMCFLIKACFQKFCHETRYLRNFGDTSSGDSSCG